MNLNRRLDLDRGEGDASAGSAIETLGLTRRPPSFHGLVTFLTHHLADVFAHFGCEEPILLDLFPRVPEPFVDLLFFELKVLAEL